MSVLGERFAALRREKRGGFIPFIVAGDPDLKSTGEILRELSRVDPVAIEIGIPFSDPTADGPVIQRAAQRAVERGVTLGGVLRLLRGLTVDEIAPLVLFSYYNPILQFGLERFARALRGCGVAGVLVVDLPADAAADLNASLRREGIDLILLVAPTTSDQRLREIVRVASGFIYAVARTGVTGKTNRLTDESKQLVSRIRKVSNLPVAVGFGVAEREQARRIWRYADAAVVGSRLVAEIEEAAKAGRPLAAAVRRCAREFAPDK